MITDTLAGLDQPVIVETGQVPTASVIFLHGLGASRHDFEPAVSAIHWPGLPPIRYVFPNAPVRSVTINGGMQMRAWYDITDPDLSHHPDTSGVQASAAILDSYIAQQIASGIPAARIVVAGFSQGGAIALHTGIRYPHQLAGILALSTYLPLPDLTATEYRSHNTQIPIFIGHGSSDAIIPLAKSELASTHLTDFGFRVEMHTYPVAHTVTPEEIRDLANWLYRVFHSPHSQ